MKSMSDYSHKRVCEMAYVCISLRKCSKCAPGVQYCIEYSFYVFKRKTIQARVHYNKQQRLNLDSLANKI